MMHIHVLTLDFHLPGVRSLKEKRGRLGGLKQRFGKSSSLAVCESAHADAHQRAQYSFVATGSDIHSVRQLLQDVERTVAQQIDATIVSVERAEL